MAKLVLVRHGQSLWNLEDRFTGWVDVPLTDKGREEARRAGEKLRDIRFDVAYTSVLSRAQETLEIILEVLAQQPPVIRDQALNERHYGDLQGKDKTQVREQYGDEQFMIWRRSYDVPPPPLPDDHPLSQAADPRYAHLPPELLPRTECLADVLHRMLPYWYDAIVPELAANRTVLVAAHGNSLRALVKHLDEIGDADIAGLNIPTGIPLVYELDGSFRPKVPGGRYLDPEAALAAAEAVRNQGR